MKRSELNKIKKFMHENLLTKQEAAKITDQSQQAFLNSVNQGFIEPFFETDGKGPGKVRLYLRSDIENYAAHKKTINQK